MIMHRLLLPFQPPCQSSQITNANVRSVIQIKVNLALTDRRANERRYTNTRNVLIGTQSICKLASIARGFPLKSKV
jgi:hypothetical protein